MLSHRDFKGGLPESCGLNELGRRLLVFAGLGAYWRMGSVQLVIGCSYVQRRRGSLQILWPLCLPKMSETIPVRERQ